MLDSQVPWFDVKPISLNNGYKLNDHNSAQQNTWQAMFACQINVLSYDERLEFRWGFAPAFLLDEAIDRQKLFIETQFVENPFVSQIHQRTLALRCINLPNSGVQLGLVAKTLADSKEKAQMAAETYWNELKSTFPYDYILHPAITNEKFYQLTGKEILEKCTDSNLIAQIRRCENTVPMSKTAIPMIGVWQTSIRSDEQIWRTLANYQKDLLLNIQIRPTTLSKEEWLAILEIRDLTQLSSENKDSNRHYDDNYGRWIDSFISRYTNQWEKYLYLQVHLVSSADLKEYTFRSIGSSITRNASDQVNPGYEVDYPFDNTEAKKWAQTLSNLEFIPAMNRNRLPRLRDLSSIDEAHAVFRLPYPPKPGFPNTRFLECPHE